MQKYEYLLNLKSILYYNQETILSAVMRNNAVVSSKKFLDPDKQLSNAEFVASKLQSLGISRKQFISTSTGYLSKRLVYVGKKGGETLITKLIKPLKRLKQGVRLDNYYALMQAVKSSGILYQIPFHEQAGSAFISAIFVNSVVETFKKIGIKKEKRLIKSASQNLNSIGKAFR
jgi:hypothetical protein